MAGVILHNLSFGSFRFALFYYRFMKLVYFYCRSCFELLLSVPENEIPYEAWVQFHHSVQVRDIEERHLLMGDFIDKNNLYV